MDGKIIKAVRNGELDVNAALATLEKTSTRLGDIEANFNSESLNLGFPTIQRHQYFLKNESSLIVMAARPGNGKTALATQIAMNVAKNDRVLMFSLEMKKEALYKRAVSVLSGVAIKVLGSDKNKTRVDKAIGELKGYALDIIDDEDLSANDIISRAYDENKSQKIALIVIDYIGLVKVNQGYRAQEIGQAAKLFKKRLANQLKVPVLLLAQMNRSFEDRYAQYLLAAQKAKLYANAPEQQTPEMRPVMSDIAESSGLEHCTDVAMFLHRPSLLDKKEPESLFKVFVAKNRSGACQDFDLEFNGALTKFNDLDNGEL